MKTKYATIGRWALLAGIALIVSCTGDKEPHAAHEAGSAAANMDMITLNEREELYANITLDTARIKPISETTTLVGKTAFDERKIVVVTSRIRGRIDRLFVRNPLAPVRQGQPLYALYSEELLSLENELLNALRQQEKFGAMQEAMNQLVESARQRLLLYGLTAAQVREIERSGEASSLITFYSPVSGYLTELPVSQGQYVEMGAPLFRIADASALWIESQMYTSELHWLSKQPSVLVTFEAFPDETYSAVPVFDNPTVEPGQKISLVRFMIKNRERKIKPGMMAYLSVRRNEKRALVIPKSAILIGSMTTAWVKTADGMYENRAIATGIQNKQEVEVLSGIKVGEAVVATGAYALQSAQVLKSGTGMGGMKM
ncbi:MAG: efflux RND transporter periplasmic adaptor subunit [Hymenobacteraceae bacterium]|uniref:Cu(I)/Ag(I) efflux system membrane fusion protein n=1 Tax=Pontibacter mucosus TaxID=1649266 RepID=A0A2T5Y9R1_9BACT|nr:efflux RND transporter periplasmic adaptor subunit [Pontibacter mucosus]MDX5482747.1 efflux RND transporter periplasmic adaptor subunit [Hymenobacteraceae bacterium]PTX13118.1 Cu(I)/Ag(I) efflux system membrane fusion protein [Pontibacter mucosus]